MSSCSSFTITPRRWFHDGNTCQFIQGYAQYVPLSIVFILFPRQFSFATSLPIASYPRHRSQVSRRVLWLFLCQCHPHVPRRSFDGERGPVQPDTPEVSRGLPG